MIARTATKIRSRIEGFSGNLSRGLGKVPARLVSEMIYGISARQSTHLTEVARSLEEPIPLAKTENRLSRNLARPAIRPVVQRAIAEGGASRIGRDTLLVLDLSDIAKPYARKMEYLARVRDGSKKELADGYWLCQVIGVEPKGDEITPLYGELYSQKAPGHVSENEEIFKAFRLVSSAVEDRGIWVIDRGGDRGEIYAGAAPGIRLCARAVAGASGRAAVAGGGDRPGGAAADALDRRADAAEPEDPLVGGPGVADREDW